MQGVAKVTVVGNLGQKPELRYTANGKAVANLSVAVNTGRRDEQKTEWITVVVWEKNAESCAEYLDAGSPVYAEGRWQTREWEDRDGNKRKKVEVVAFQILFLGRPDAGAQGAGTRDSEAAPGADDNDIPF
ncbi:MAG: single-stranded DNA-binding protein [bacterium]|nr:single-stranded DNA-binding protein [bacterium]